MTTNQTDKQKIWSVAQLIIFVTGFIIACIPVFSMDYLITLDGPNHLYASKTFYSLFGGDSFYDTFFSINENFTPNYFTILVLGGLQQIFSAAASLKIFHLLHIVLLISGIYFWNNGHRKKQISYPFLAFPLIYSYLFFSGFYNFIFAVSFSFWTLGFYERFKSKDWNPMNYIVVGAVLLLTYCSHIIPFFFAGLYLFIDTLVIWKKSNWSKKELRHGILLFAASFPGLLLTILFMGSRTSEYNWLDTSELISRLTSGFSIVIKPESSEQVTMINWTKLITLGIALMLFVYQFLGREKNKNWTLLITTSTILALYFVLPDSVGYASVFSVRIEYIFWLFIIVGASKAALDNIYLTSISAIAGIGLLIFQISANLPYWKLLNGHGKSIVAASEHVENNAVIYPVFNSLYWDDYHVSNLLGTQEKDVMILENTSARQDYFPLIYKAPYEDCIKSELSDQFFCSEQEVKVDYLLVVGRIKLDPNDVLATKLYSKAFYEGSVVYEDDFVQLLKFP